MKVYCYIAAETEPDRMEQWKVCTEYADYHKHFILEFFRGYQRGALRPFYEMLSILSRNRGILVASADVLPADVNSIFDLGYSLRTQDSRLIITDDSLLPYCDGRVIAALRSYREHRQAVGLLLENRMLRDAIVVPYGWNFADGIPVPDPEEQRQIELVLAKQRLGKSDGRIAKEMNEMGYNRRGFNWNPESVQGVLMGEMLGSYPDGEFEPIRYGDETDGIQLPW